MPSSSLLNNKRFFPPFRNLPDYDGINEVYQTDPYRSGVVTNRIHWCFVGEIIADASIVRPVFHVQDRVGKKTIVALYLDNDATGYDASKFVVGNTICIMYAFKKTFLDGSEGIRVEDIETIQALPCSLQKLMEVGEFVAAGHTTCNACDKPAVQSCGRCRGVKYCNKECQSGDWKAHKLDCPIIKVVRGWNSYNWNHFDDFHY